MGRKEQRIKKRLEKNPVKELNEKPNPPAMLGRME